METQKDLAQLVSTQGEKGEIQNQTKTYEASYKIDKDYFECGTFMPDEPAYPKKRIQAKSDFEAYTFAISTETIQELTKNYSNPKVKLEGLVEIPVEPRRIDLNQMKEIMKEIQKADQLELEIKKQKT